MASLKITGNVLRSVLGIITPTVVARNVVQEEARLPDKYLPQQLSTDQATYSECTLRQRFKTIIEGSQEIS